MKIALIIKDLRHCGAQRAIARLSFVLEQAGYDIFMVLLTSGEVDYKHAGELIIIDSPIVKCFLGKIMTTIHRTRELKRVKEKYKFNVAISFLDTPNISNLLTKGKEKVFVSVRNFKSLEDNGVFGFLNRIMIKKLYPKADKVIVVSKAILDDMATNYKVPRDKIGVIYNPFDINCIISQSKEKIPVGYRDFYKDHKVIISVGRLSYQKGYWNLIKAFAHLKAKRFDLRLVIIGDGEQDKELLELTKGLGIEKDVLFAGYQDNPFSFIKNADIYALTSLFEGFPNALVEAMACGVPVVSTDCKSGPREILYINPDYSCQANDIEYADYGLLCPVFNKVNDDWNVIEKSNNQLMFAKAIEILLNDDKLAADYSQKALKRVKDFSYDDCRNRYIEMITG